MSDSPNVQWTNTENVDQLRPWFVDRNEPNYAWKSACASVMALPALRAFWPLSSVDYTTASRARDVSGGAYHLSDNNTVTFGYDQLAPYAELDGVNQYLSRADGGAANWADITGTEAYIIAAQRGLTLGGWFYFDNAASGNEMLLTKDDSSPQRGYFLRRNAAGTCRLGVSVDGNALTSVDSTATIGATTWAFVVGRFVPSTSLDIYINGVKASNVAAIPASIFDSTAPVQIGAVRAIATFFLDGRASLCWLCAAALSDSIITALYHQTRKLYGV